MIQSEDTINTIIITFIINTTNSSTSIRQILQSAQNSVYPTTFTLIHNLITYTTLRINHLKSDKKIFTMAKSPPKLLESQSNQRTRIHRHIKVKISKNPQQQLYRIWKQGRLTPSWSNWINQMEMEKSGETTLITMHHSMNQSTRKALSMG